MLNRRDFLATCSAAPLAAAASSKPLIWDVHCHMLAAPGETPEQRVGYMIPFMDRLGIDRVVLSIGYPLTDDPSPDLLRTHNDQVIRATERWPDRTLGFVFVNPNHPEFSVREIDRCVRDGPLVGVKLLIESRANSPLLDPIAERAGALGVPIFQHAWFKVMGNSPGESTPAELAHLAARHPKTTFIDAHTGGDWELGILAVRGLKNISVCVAGFDPTAGVVEMAVRELGAERVVYGSDAVGRSFASQLSKVTGAEIPESARRLILGENLRRMLAPVLKAKGRQL